MDIFEASSKGTPRDIEQIGGDLEVHDAHGHTPLHRAIYNGKLDNARKLLELGANVRGKNCKSEAETIQVAVAHGSAESVKFLIEAGAPTDIKPIGRYETLIDLAGSIRESSKREAIIAALSA